jgi:hypothetical protein
MNSIDELVRVAVVADPTRLCGTQARLLEALARRTLPGFHVDLGGCDGVSVPVGHRHDLVHVLGPGSLEGPVAVAGEHDISLVAGFGAAVQQIPARDWHLILSPGPSADAELLAAGARPSQLRRWQPGVDHESFGPAHYSAGALPRGNERINVLHVGTPEQPELLAAAFGAAAALEPRLHLVMVGADADADLPRLYASADLLLHLSSSAEFPLAIIEAQASGLPVLAVDAGSARELIEDGRDGVLVPPSRQSLAEALLSLTRRATLRERLTVGGLGAVRDRTWERSLTELASAWNAALARPRAGLMRAA